MLLILLMILRILLKIVLAILLIILVLLLIFLLVPLCYKVYVKKDDAVKVRADGSWLLRLVRGGARVDTSSSSGTKPHIWFKAAWLTLYDNMKDTGSQDQTEKDEPAGFDEVPEEAPVSIPVPGQDEDAAGSAETAPETAETAPESAETIPEAADTAQELPEKKSLRERLREKADRLYEKADELSVKIARILEALADMPEKVWDKADAVSDKLDSIWDKADSLITKKEKITRILEEERCRKYIGLCLRQLRKIMIYLLPRIDFMHLHFGFADPALTGKVLGYLAFLYSLYGDRMTVIPEFEEEILEGEAQLSGKIRAGRLVWYMLPVVLNPCFFRLIKQVRSL